MGCHHPEVLIPVVISALLLWEGVQCRADGYRLEISSQVTVQAGLCIHIPCRFFYPPSRDDSHTKLYGFWYLESKQTGKIPLVATNNPERIGEIEPHFRHRFEVSRKLNSGDCSLTINGAEPGDKATYHFRMERGHKKCSYTEKHEKVSVVVTERKLDITIVGPIRAGKRESIFCKTPICSSLAVPNFTWIHSPQISALEISQTVSHGSVESRMDFIPTAADHRQNVSCKVTYGEESRLQSTQKTISLNVHYPPRNLRISGQIEYPDLYVGNLPNDTNIQARVGDFLLVRCEADANPASNQTWVRIPRRLITQEHVSGNELKFSDVHLKHGGEYECEAKNQEGSSREVFYLQITGNDNIPLTGP